MGNGEWEIRIGDGGEYGSSFGLSVIEGQLRVSQRAPNRSIKRKSASVARFLCS